MEKILEKACSTPGCGKGSTLQCPTCVKLGLPPSYFCSQECFKNFWPIHKFVHLKGRKYLKIIYPFFFF